MCFVLRENQGWWNILYTALKGEIHNSIGLNVNDSLHRRRKIVYIKKFCFYLRMFPFEFINQYCKFTILCTLETKYIML